LWFINFWEYGIITGTEAKKIILLQAAFMTGEILKAKRTAARIPGEVLCRKAAIGRTRLSGIERGYIHTTECELKRLFTVLDEIVTVRREVRKLALRLGWPSAAEIAPQ
jgi:transcriptional regulator with XRE-family HTH domain